MEQQKGWSTWSPLTKALVLIGAIVGFFFLAGLAAFAYGMYWLYGAGDQADTQVAISPTAVGYVRWVAAEDDPGIEETLKRFAAALSKVQQQQQQDVPAPLRMMMQLQQSQQAESFRIFWPRAVTASFEPSETSDRFVLALNMRGMGGIVKGMFKMMTSQMMQEGESELRPIEYRDHRILASTSTSSEVAFSLLGSTILIGNVEDLKGVIDREVDQKIAQPDPRLATIEKIVAPASDLYWVHLSPPQIPGADVGLGVDVVTADRWQAIAIVRTETAEALPAAIAATEDRIEDVREELGIDGIQVAAYRSELDARTARWDLTIENVASSLERSMMEELTKQPAP